VEASDLTKASDEKDHCGVGGAALSSLSVRFDVRLFLLFFVCCCSETPKEERERQFRELVARSADRFPTAEAFARYLVSDSTASQRRKLLEEYYAAQ